jgi:hypothetical protein
MAWTITETSNVYKMKHQQGDELLVVKLACTSDAGASDHDLTTDVKGSWLYLVRIVPGTAADVPDAVFDLDIEDETNSHILDTDANPVAGTTFHIGSATVGVFPPVISTCSLVCATLGDGKKADFYLYFTR